MNWFERYGIAGLYFVFLLTTLYWINYSPTLDKETTLKVLGIALSASIPLGYVLMIFSQILYYKISPWQVHHKAWNNAKKGEETSEELLKRPGEVKFPEDFKDKIRYDESRQRLIFKGIMSINEKKKLLNLYQDELYKKAIVGLYQRSQDEQEEKEELLVEAKVAILDRFPCDKVEEGRRLQEWFTKRFDVLAINSALILATIIGLVLCVLVLFFNQESQGINPFYVRVFGAIYIVIFIILCFSNCLLTKQTEYVATEYYKTLKNKSGGNTT